MQQIDDWRAFAPKAEILAKALSRRTRNLPSMNDHDDYYAMLLTKAWLAWKRTEHLPTTERRKYTKQALENQALDLTRRAQAQSRGLVVWGVPSAEVLEGRPGASLEDQCQAAEALSLLVKKLSPTDWHMLLVMSECDVPRAGEFDSLSRWRFLSAGEKVRARAEKILSLDRGAAL